MNPIRNNSTKLISKKILIYFVVWGSCVSSLANAKSNTTFTGSLGGEGALFGSWFHQGVNQDKGSEATPISIGSVGTLRVAFDFPLNHFLSLGGELGVSWMTERLPILVDDSKEKIEAGKRLAFAPAVRARMDFPLDCRWVIEAIFAAGGSIWSATRGGPVASRDEKRLGVMWRGQLGARYLLNTEVHLFAGVSYMEQEVYGDSGGRGIAQIPISLGLRGGF